MVQQGPDRRLARFRRRGERRRILPAPRRLRLDHGQGRHHHGLLAAEITARTGQDPSQFYASTTADLGQSFYARIDAPATTAQKAVLARLDPSRVEAGELAGSPIEAKLARAPGNNEPIGGLKVATAKGWFAARPSGTEEVYKIYAESFVSADHLKEIQADAQALVSRVFEAA